MIAVDTNILVYAHREDAPFHSRALKAITGLAEGDAPWAIPWPCLHEFLSIATHPRIFNPPTPLAIAIEQVDSWLESPGLVLLAESDVHWTRLASLLKKGEIVGPRIHDARIAALCLSHGVKELWSADRDFGRFPTLKVKNPLLH